MMNSMSYYPLSLLNIIVFIVITMTISIPEGVNGFSTTVPIAITSRNSDINTNTKLYDNIGIDKTIVSEDEMNIALEKATKAMTAFTNKYLQISCTTLCNDKSIPAVVIKGLAEHKVTLGTPLCPCRFYDDKVQEAKDGYWNCPCVPMRERQECHCMLFLTNDNQFAGTDTTINYNEVLDLTTNIDL